MNTKNTWAWFILAAALFAAIFLLDHFVRPPAMATPNVLPGLQPADITSVHVIPAGTLEIRADRVKHAWLLAKPIDYPGQSTAIETLLTALQKLAPATRISANELHEHRNANLDFGFDVPQFSIVLEAGDQRWQLLVGNKTPPGDQVFLRVVGVDGAFVTDAGWLKFIPPSANDWRSTALVTADANLCDAIVLTNAALVIELRRNATNHLWNMTRPLQARADTERITTALQDLQAAGVTKFIADDAKTDFATFGLQPAALSLWLNHGTNLISALQTGKIVTNDPAQIYAKRESWNVIVTTPKEPLAYWNGTVNDFRDPHLLELAAPVTEIEMRGHDNFLLRQQGSNLWSVVGEKFAADPETVQLFIKALASLRVGFVKDVATAPDLPAYGLDSPTREIILRTAAGDTNAIIAQLAFASQTNGIFVHRADEDSVYSITPEDGKILFGESSLFESACQFRDRHIWNFSENDVTQITLRQSGKTRTLVHNGPNKWSLAPGSEGIIDPNALEETAHRLGGLTASGWLGRNVTTPEKFGLDPANLEITIDLKNGEKRTVNFGSEISQTALAAVTLDGERWAFVFPAALYQFVLSYLVIPTNVR